MRLVLSANRCSLSFGDPTVVITMSLNKKNHTMLLILLFTVLVTVLAEYKTVYLEDTCKTNETLRISLGASGEKTAQIVASSRNMTPLINRNCTIYVLPPLGLGVVLSIRYLNMNPFTEPECRNYILLSDIEGPNNTVRLCSHNDDVTEFQSYSSTEFLTILFHNENSPLAQSYFTFVVTAFEKPNTHCSINWFSCADVSRCIWNGLTCDGHNNCGDQSDELPSTYARCGETHDDSDVVLDVALFCAIFFGILLFVVLPLVYCCVRLRKRRNLADEERTRIVQADSRAEETARSAGHTNGEVTSYHTASSGTGPEVSGSSGAGTYQDLPPAYKP